ALEYHEGCSLVLLQKKIARQRQHVIHAKAATHRRLAVAEWVPRKSQAGLKILKRRILIVGTYAIASGARLRRDPKRSRRVELGAASHVGVRGGLRVRLKNTDQAPELALRVAQHSGHFVS